MFGYHDSTDCKLDLWSPEPTRWGDNAIENRAFSPFCKHQQEIMDIVDRIAAGEISIDLDDNFHEDDLEFLNICLRERGLTGYASLV